MPDHVYTLDEVRTGIRQIAAANAGFVYSAPPDSGACLYIHGEKLGTGCLIGRFLQSINVPISVLRKCDDLGIIDTCASRVLPDAGFRFELDAIEWMTKVQNQQDCKEPWGRAVEQADQEMNLGA